MAWLTKHCLQHRSSPIAPSKAISSPAIDDPGTHEAIMASKSATMPSAIGSSPWLDQENQQVAQFSAQETEDFAFSVRNELDFLNEHLAEIFSKNQVYGSFVHLRGAAYKILEILRRSSKHLGNYEARLHELHESEIHWKSERYCPFAYGLDPC